MRALVLSPGTSSVRIEQRPEPAISAPNEVKLRVLQTGICGTDREEASGGRALAPNGHKELVMGHEMFGEVVDIGGGVTSLKRGDFAHFTVRRGCGGCLPCEMNRSDMCRTGHFRERGIWGQDGYDADFVVDKEQYAVKVPAEIRSVGVLTEPASVVEKALDEAVRLQIARLPDAASTPHWLAGRRCLVAGLGPVGLLGALILRLRDADVYGIDIVDENSARPQWLETIGGKYIDGRKVPAAKVDEAVGPMDLILEAAGIASLDFDLVDALAVNGVYVLTGIPGGDSPLKIPGADLMRKLVLKNQLIVGSVNAAPDHYRMAVADLLNAQLRWNDHVSKLVTHRYPVEGAVAAFGRHPSDEIKAVVEWDAGVTNQRGT